MSSIFTSGRASTATQTSAGDEALQIRPATDADTRAILGLLGMSMGWLPDEQHARLFRWKHRENPSGASLAWVALDGDQVVGFRTFMRWRFTYGGSEVSAVRAVDTATHPDHRGRGIFTRLTRHGLDALHGQGVELVFNTPNERSLPGYLKLGWQPVGRLPIAVRLRAPLSLARLVRSRTPASKWSTATTAGVPAAEALASVAAVESLLREAGGTLRAGREAAALHTARTVEHLRWRYGFAPLHYRAVTVSEGPEDGLAIFRLRHRGPAMEAAVCEMLVPGDGVQAQRHLLTRIVSETGADHAVLLGRARLGCGTLPVPRQGPTLVYRPVGRSEVDRPGSGPAPSAWGLTLGDIELL